MELMVEIYKLHDIAFVIDEYLQFSECEQIRLHRTIFFASEELAKINHANENNCISVNHVDIPFSLFLEGYKIDLNKIPEVIP